MEAMFLMAMLLLGIMIGLSVGYPLGLFIDALDNRIKNDRR
jgi:capsular polysaccharide biosynthesis protein